MKTGREEGIPYSILVEEEWARVTAVLPGIREEKIMLDFDDKTLVISASGPTRTYRVSIGLPWEARLEAKRFTGGVLQLTLERERAQQGV